jgi:hypothetical protein
VIHTLSVTFSVHASRRAKNLRDDGTWWGLQPPLNGQSGMGKNKIHAES